MSLKIHELKTINPYFTEAWYGRKPWELRKDDRGFQVGDTVVLIEYDPVRPPTIEGLAEREIRGKINFILREVPGIKKGYCIFSYEETDRSD